MANPRVVVEVITDLPDDCILGAIGYLDPRLICACRRLCRRFRDLVEHPTIWRVATIQGHVTSATRVIENALVPRATMIRCLAFDNVDFVTGLVLPASEPLQELRHRFFSAVETLLAKIGPKLEELHLDESGISDGASSITSATNSRARSPLPPASITSPSSNNDPTQGGIFSTPHDLISPLCNSCPNILRISLASGEESDYVGDDNVLMLTNCCPRVQEFRDDEHLGVTALAVNHMADGWRDLRSLELNTEWLACEEFCGSLRLFGNRLRRLSVTHFKEPICMGWAYDPSSPEDEDEVGGSGGAKAAKRFDVLVETLAKLTRLEVLALDLSVTRHRDGLGPGNVARIMEACPRLMGFEYFAPYDAYFDADEDGNDGDGASSMFYHGNMLGGTGKESVYGAGQDDPATEFRVKRPPFGGDSIFNKSRRGSGGSASLMTVNTGYFFLNRHNARPSGGGADRYAGSVSVLSRDESDDRDEDVTSLAPGLPSPNPLGGQRRDVYGTWTSDEAARRGVKQQAEEELLQYGRFLTQRGEEFFGVLEEIAALCKTRGVKVTLAWSF